MNILLWILQIVFGLYFLLVGIMHFIVPPGLPPLMGWMYNLSPTLHWISGAAEILGGLGLILPAVLRIQTRLVVWAAAGLAVVMALATVYHILRGEIANVLMTLIISAVMAFVAYGRARLAPLKDRESA